MVEKAITCDWVYSISEVGNHHHNPTNIFIANLFSSHAYPLTTKVMFMGYIGCDKGDKYNIMEDII